MLILTYYNVLRLSRRRELMAVLLVLPLAGALVHCAWPRVCAWMFPVLCAALVAGVAWLRHASDRASGLAAAITCSPVTASRVLRSHFLTATALFAVQMAIYGAVLAVCS